MSFPPSQSFEILPLQMLKSIHHAGSGVSLEPAALVYTYFTILTFTDDLDLIFLWQLSALDKISTFLN